MINNVFNFLKFKLLAVGYLLFTFREMTKPIIRPKD